MKSVNTIGSRIARVRTLRGCTQGQLARALNIAPGSLCRIEQADNVETATLERIAAALGFAKFDDFAALLWPRPTERP